MTKMLTSLALVLTLCAISTTADARPRSRGLICGAVQMAHFGITNSKYRLAKAWTDFRRVSAQVGAVVVSYRSGKDSAGNPGGHVARIVALTNDPCKAVVADPRGQYQRNICKNQIAIVMPDQSGRTEIASNQRQRSIKSVKRHKPVQYAAITAVPDQHRVQ